MSDAPPLKTSTLKRKLMLIGMATTGIALLLAGLVVVAHEIASFRRFLVDSLTVQATMIGRNSTVALAFNNRKDAEDILQALDSSPNIRAAVIYTKEGVVFSRYLRSEVQEGTTPLRTPADGHDFGINRLSLGRPVLLDGERIGSIFIESDLKEFYTRIWWYAAVALAAFSGAMWLAFLLFSRLQRKITAPINELVALAQTVSRDNDYSVRSVARQDDETGTLAAAFNEMLAQIQQGKQELERHHRSLEEQVFLRTEELARTNEQLKQELTERKRVENQLHHAQKMEAVGVLAGGVAHDFNNILTAIIGFGTLLRMKMEKDDPLQRYADGILTTTQRAVTLTQSLLTFSRKQDINPLPVDINGIIARTGKMLARLIGEDIALTLKPAAGELVTVADSGQIEQVLMNLVTNARDAMPGGGTLLIATERTILDEQFIAAHAYGKPGPYVLITVADDGSGMDNATVARIFEPFFSTKEIGRGTGLGLSIVYGIVKQHDGFINVYSEPGRGTTFKIYLPLIAAEVELEEPQQEHALPARYRGAETVLVAEDEDILRRLASSVLGESGYTVIEAWDGEDAIDKIGLNRRNIDLLLLDVIMPKKNGREVYEAAKKIAPSVKVLFMSGYTADIIRSRQILDEGQHFISKPLSPIDLLKKIREVMESR